MSVMDHSLQQVEEPDLVNLEVMLNDSEFFRAECKRLMLETGKACKYQRVRDIQLLKKELELLDEIIVETDVLIGLQSRVMKALKACKEPLRVIALCLKERLKGTSFERLHDKVSIEMVTEGVTSLLERVAEQVSEQIGLKRSAKSHLELDLKEKIEAHNIDNFCALMTVHSINTQQMSKYTSTALPRQHTSGAVDTGLLAELWIPAYVFGFIEQLSRF